MKIGALLPFAFLVATKAQNPGDGLFYVFSKTKLSFPALLSEAERVKVCEKDFPDPGLYLMSDGGGLQLDSTYIEEKMRRAGFTDYNPYGNKTTAELDSLKHMQDPYIDALVLFFAGNTGSYALEFLLSDSSGQGTGLVSNKDLAKANLPPDAAWPVLCPLLPLDPSVTEPPSPHVKAGPVPVTVATPELVPKAAPEPAPAPAATTPGQASGPAPGPPALAKSHGDPHFQTFSGIKYDFHGGCDLVLFGNSNFVDGLGVSVHVRTKIKTWWSYIESAVLRVGKNTLEVMGGINGGHFWINGKEQREPKDGGFLSLSGLKVSFHRVSSKQFRFRLDFGHGDAIAIETFKSFVAVNVRAKTDRFKGSVGLLGSFPEGKMLARDGKTLVEDADSFGKEWQVLSSEPQLFQSVEGPQHPQECTMPDKAVTKTKKRRLGETLITEEDAAIACAHVDEDDKNACIFDVLATNDKEMAGSY